MGEDQPQRRFLTTQEAAEYVRESPRTLEGRRVSGDGPVFYKAGKGRAARVLYRREDLDAWVEARAFQSTSEYGVTK